MKAILRRLLTPPSTNYAFRSIGVKPYSMLPPAALIFDIGSGDERGIMHLARPLPTQRSSAWICSLGPA